MTDKRRQDGNRSQSPMASQEWRMHEPWQVCGRPPQKGKSLGRLSHNFSASQISFVFHRFLPSMRRWSALLQPSQLCQITVGICRWKTAETLTSPYCRRSGQQVGTCSGHITWNHESYTVTARSGEEHPLTSSRKHFYHAKFCRRNRERERDSAMLPFRDMDRHTIYRSSKPSPVVRLTDHPARQ